MLFFARLYISFGWNTGDGSFVVEVFPEGPQDPYEKELRGVEELMAYLDELEKEGKGIRCCLTIQRMLEPHEVSIRTEAVAPA